MRKMLIPYLFLLSISSGAQTKPCDPGKVSVQNDDGCSCESYERKTSYSPCGKITQTPCASGFQKSMNVDLAKQLYGKEYHELNVGMRMPTIDLDKVGFCKSVISGDKYIPLEFDQVCAPGFVAVQDVLRAEISRDGTRACVQREKLGEIYYPWQQGICASGYSEIGDAYATAGGCKKNFLHSIEKFIPDPPNSAK